MRLNVLFCLAVTALGCQAKNAPAPAQPEGEAAQPEGEAAQPEGDAAQPDSTKDECVVPTTDALARYEGITEDQLSLLRDIDFNGDGQKDTIVRVRSGREPDHLLYIRERGCIRFLDKVEAFRMGCEHEAVTNGYCDIWVETWLHHGDRMRSIMVYGEGGYEATGEGVLIPGPRDRPQ